MGAKDIGTGVTVNYSKIEHQASHKIWPTVISGGQYIALDWSKLK